VKKKGLILIILSVVLGAGTFLGIYQYIARIEQSVQVVVASKSIPPYTEITEEYLTVENKSNINIPEDSARNIEQVLGMYSGDYGIYQNDVVTRSKVNKKDEISDNLLASTVASGKVALALDVDLVRSVGGIVKKNDYVDVSVINDEFEVTPIKSIKVLSVKDKDANDMDKSKLENPIPSAVILEATAAERDVVIKLLDRGSIHLSLRNPADVTETIIDQDAVQRLEEYQRQQKQNQQEDNANSSQNNSEAPTRVNTNSEAPAKVNTNF